MTFEELYRDVYSRLAVDGDNHDIYFDDIRKAINDSIRMLRIEYAQNQIAHELATTETISSLTEDTDYPFVNSGSLTDEVLSEIPLRFAVLSSRAYTTDNEILDQTQSFTEGDIARKGDTLYECVHTFNTVNTFNDTFDPRNYRTYYRANRINYDAGDVVFDKESSDWFKVNTGFTATQDDTADNVAELDRLYWKEIGKANVYVAHYPFNNIQALRIFESLRDSQAITIKDNKIYSTKDISEVTLTYIPRWTDLVDFADVVDIPDFMVPQVKNQALRTLGQKLNVDIELKKQELPQTKRDNNE